MTLHEINTEQLIQLDYWSQISKPKGIRSLQKEFPNHKFLELDIRNHKFAVFLTHDIDFHVLESIIARSKIQEIKQPTQFFIYSKTLKLLAKIIKGLQIFPVDNICRVIDLEKEYGISSTIFLPVYRTKTRRFAAKLSQILGSGFELGLHASPECSNNSKKLIYEKNSFKQITGRNPVSCRFHLLRYHHRQTIESLEKARFIYDSTYGYNNSIGFRGGISYIFKPYNLNLLEVPLTIMDMVLWNYLRLTPAKSYKLIKELIDNVAKIKGIITFNWHSDYVYYDEYFAVLRKAIEYMLEKDGLFITINQIQKYLVCE